MKIGIFSDLHLGLKQYGLKEREEDFYNQYQLAIDYFIKFNVDVVICAGDVFDVHRPSPYTLKIFVDGLKRLADAGIVFLNVVGNHSMIQREGFVTADAFLENSVMLQNYYLLNEEQSFITDDVFIGGLPFHYNYDLDSLQEKIKKLNEKAIFGTNILVLHQSFKEFCGFTGEDFSINDIDVSNFDLVVCGHIHERLISDVGNFVFLQPGSLERSSVAEARDEENQGKGIFIIDTNKSITGEQVSNSFIRLKSDRRFFISDMYLNNKDELKDMKNEILDGISDCVEPPILFLTVHDISDSFYQIVDMTKNLRDEFLTVNFNYMDENPEKFNKVITDSTDIPTPREALKIALNPLDEDQAKLALDLYDLLKDGKDASKLLEDFRKKHQTEYEPKQHIDEDELNELIEYFENL